MPNLPNSLTLARLVFGSPLVVGLYFIGQYYAAFAVFVFFAITDAFDGWYARKFNQCSPLGAFIDPAADKVLCLPVMFLTCWHFDFAWWFVAPFLISVGYDASVMIMRLFDAGMRTSRIAKWKEITRMLALCACMLSIGLESTWLTNVYHGGYFVSYAFTYGLAVVMLWVTAAFTLYSAYAYAADLLARAPRRARLRAYAQPAE